MSFPPHLTTSLSRMPPKPPPNSKKAKLYNSRTIRTETADPAIKDGVLDVPQFLASREFEIRAFEQSQLNTKYASSTRVFQSLPRTLRRRTASHNVKRIPKRLRNKAIREMQSATGTPAKKPHLRGRELYKLRMQKKLLRLASKIKELRALPKVQGLSVQEKIKGLNEQIDQAIAGKKRSLNNGVGAYDIYDANKLAPVPNGNVKYAHRQKEFTWCPTHMWHAKRFHMIKRWGYQIPFSPNQKCFRSTSRTAKQSALAFDTSYYGEMVVEFASDALLTAWLTTFTKYNAPVPQWLLGLKAYHDWIYVNDKKLATGMVMVDMNLKKILVRVHPSVYKHLFAEVVDWASDEVTVYDTRFALGSIQLQGPLSLQCLAKVLHLETTPAISDAWRSCSQVMDSQAIPTGTVFSFFAKDPRFWKHPVNPPPLSTKSTAFLTNGQAYIDQDAMSSLLLSDGRTSSYNNMYTLKQLGKEFSRHDPSSTHIHGASKFPVLVTKLSNGTWCVNLPWFWTQPVWSQLVRVTSIKIGGVRQEHQVNFERGLPTYPHDFPFTLEGYKEHILLQTAAQAAREKLPRSKRAPMATEGRLTLGCDWFFLRKWIFGLKLIERKDNVSSHGEFTDDRVRVIRNTEELAVVINNTRKTEVDASPVVLYSRSDPVHKAYIEGTFKPDISKFPQLPVVQVHLELTGKGKLSDNARIYELHKDTGMEQLIGFVTSGSYNFRHGTPTGIGLIAAKFKDEKKVHVRNVGCTTYSIAKIQLIK